MRNRFGPIQRRAAVAPVKLPPPPVKLPSDEELLALVERHPGASTKTLAAAIWPSRPWYPNHNTCRPHESAHRLAESLSRLVAQGQLVEVHLADEVDALAQRGWMLPGATVRGAPPPKQNDDPRRRPRHSK